MLLNSLRLLGTAAVLIVALPATAATTIATGAFGVSSSVKAANTVAVTVGPIAKVGGTTSPGYDVTGGVATVDAEVGLGSTGLTSTRLGLDTGIIVTNASANGTTPADTTMGRGYSQIADVDASLFTQLLGVKTVALGLTADLITSETKASRIGNITTLSGKSILSNVDLSLLGIKTLDLGLNAEVAPNFVALSLLGLRVVLNEQIFTTGADGSQMLETNALRITLNDYLLGGKLLSGDVIIGNSFAFISADDQIGSAVPEPATWLQLLAGFGLAGTALRRRRHRSLVAMA